MNIYELFWHKDQNQVVVKQEGATAPEGFEHIGQHEDKPGNVLINTIRGLLYHHGHYNMQALKVHVDDDVTLNPRPADQGDQALSTQLVSEDGTSDVTPAPAAETGIDEGATNGSNVANSQQDVDNSSASAQDASKVPDAPAVDTNDETVDSTEETGSNKKK